jgi:hypothetical protein
VVLFSLLIRTLTIETLCCWPHEIYVTYPQVRRLRNATLKHVREQFGIEKNSTVSSIIERVKHEMDIDKGLKNRLQILY